MSPQEPESTRVPENGKAAGISAGATELLEGSTQLLAASGKLSGGTQLLGPPHKAVDEREGALLMGRYQVLSKLGAGGMGTVYLAEHLQIGKRFALKVLASEHAHNADLVARFRQEARAASMIHHDNVVEITDFGDTPDGSVFFVMEHLHGESLGALIGRERCLPWPRARGILLQICRAIAAAHDAGIIHRDLKPENCFLVEKSSGEDFIKVLDFGIAKIIGSQDDNDKGLTRTGQVFGTPEYMSPEQAQGAPLDGRVDIYAAGVIAYEMLTGRTPFTGNNFMAVLTKHAFEAPCPPRQACPEAEISPAVEALVLRTLAKDPAQRFASMRDMIAAVEAIDDGGNADGIAATQVRDLGAAVEVRSTDKNASTSSRRWMVAAAAMVVLFVAGWLAMHASDDKSLGNASVASSTNAMAEAHVVASVRPPVACTGDKVLVQREQQSFCIDRAEVTVGQYAACVAAGACEIRTSQHRADLPSARSEFCNYLALGPDVGHDVGSNAANVGAQRYSDHPMNCVALADARSYCSFVGGRLPSLEQWRFAALVGNTEKAGVRVYPWGGELPENRCEVAHLRGCKGGRDGDKGTAASQRPGERCTPDGVCGLAGNVSEWLDSAAPTAVGGSWADDTLSRWDQVQSLPAGERQVQLGFRCIAEVSDPNKATEP